jgi:cation diffusion facilitator CzcD-associated flavoprotein CzcO
MAGILSAIKLLEAGFKDVTVYEKADRIGGTWRENTYPGLTCDVPSHSYTYSFEPNPDWTRQLPPGAEIQQYFERTVVKYGVDKLTRFNEEITCCEFREGRWYIETSTGRKDSAEFVIAATGVLHHPAYPDIEGVDRFGGALFHSARWDHNIALDGKRIGIIGNGSTGVQIVSALVDRASKVTHFQRTPQWIMPVENPEFTEQEKAAFQADRDLLLRMRNDETYLANVERFTTGISHPDSKEMKEIEDIVLANLENSVADPALREQLRPNYRAACKRLIFSPDYYQAIQQPDARVVTQGIECIEETGVRTTDGELHGFDLIVLATGFRADQFMRPMRIIGRNKVTLERAWARRPSAYRSVAIADFPNRFR